mgnify:CR=1 FL=1
MDRKEYLSMSHNDRQKITDKIKEILSADGRVVFAYVFGSFLDSKSFRDIDVGIYFNKILKEEVFNEEIKMAEKISKKCELSIDIIDAKILNFTPSHFLNNVFKNGTVLLSKNEKLLSSIIEETSLTAVANEFFAYQSLKELVPR